MADTANVDKQFLAALEVIQKGGKDGPKLSNNEKLTFYALFKQATIGKCNIPAPSRLKLIEKAKFDAWNALGSMSQQEAKQNFLKEFEAKTPKAKL